MLFCENGTSWDNVWVDNGINRCFFQSTTAVILFLIIFILGLVQCSMYSRYAIRVDPRRVSGSYGHTIQILATSILITEALVHMILYNLYLGQHGNLYIYQVVEACLIVTASSVSLWLMGMERRSMLPSVPGRGQGVVLLLYWALFFIKENLNFVSWNNPTYWWQLTRSGPDYVELALFIIRYCSLLTILLFAFSVKNSPYIMLDEETGQVPKEASTWKNVFAKLRMMLPYVWPKGNVLLQVFVVLCLIILVLGRVINVFVPIYSKYIVNSLTYDEDRNALEYRWDYILIFAMLSFFKGGGTGTTGLLNNLRSLLWIKVQQFTTRSVQVKLFSHLHSLSLRWHLGRKTGEVLRVVDRGTNSINSLLSYVLFQIAPTIVDIIIAIVYFITFFDYLFGLIVFASMSLYLVVTFAITEWRTKFRRQMNLKDNAANARAVDSLLNFETVKYYEASEYERERYQEAILDYQSSEYMATASLNLLNLLQNIVNSVGLAGGSLLCAWAVVDSVNNKTLTVGDYVLFGTYLAQLYVPLNWLGTYYRMIQQSFIDMENMFDLLDQDMEVQDVPDAKDIAISGGRIEFENVDFSYEPSKQILKNISFSVPPGHTFALVGHTGCGKSTIVRLLFRFYDIQAGKIRIDGQDISMVTQSSLRHQIGVVPQDTVLFNNDIRYNIRYGNVQSEDEAVEDAARAAEIHNRILTFPKQYETMVGERGLKLSGGEKQRIAIARTLLKAPAIVLLDEATSALDTKTERHIQSSLARVCENRTTIIVAHRLSTIANAHRIIVLNEGEILEQGTHEELMRNKGHYAEMWNQQLISQKEAEEKEKSNGNVAAEDDGYVADANNIQTNVLV